MTAVLELDAIHTYYDKSHILKGVSMTVGEGELVALLGRNGAGKTTLFNLISGFFPPSEGQITFDGRPIQTVNPGELVKRGIIRTFQITEIFRSLTVYENLRIAVEVAQGVNLRPWMGRALRKRIDDQVDELMHLVKISGKADRVTGEMSHGDQRVVEVGIALARRPKLLLLDEPTAGMGDEETHHMTALIRDLNKNQGIATLFVEHDMEIVFGIADRITVLDNGTLLAEGTADEIANNARVQAAYLGQAA